MGSTVEKRSSETAARGPTSTGSGSASVVSIAVTAVIATVLVVGALVVIASLVLAAVVVTLCVVAFCGARRALVPRSRHRFVGEPRPGPRAVIDGTATVVRTTERHPRS
jgi:Flp pilus assembly protein TadB